MKVYVVSKQPITGILDAYKRSRGNDSNAEKLQKCMEMGHWNLFGHAQITFGIEGISRACSHQLVRHWSNVFTQQSQRFIDPTTGDDWYVIPPSVKENKRVLANYMHRMTMIAMEYQRYLKAGIPFEDARFILPNACKTELTMSCRLRDLWHFLKARTGPAAQWEIHELANRMLALAIKEYPEIFVGDTP